MAHTAGQKHHRPLAIAVSGIPDMVDHALFFDDAERILLAERKQPAHGGFRRNLIDLLKTPRHIVNLPVF